MNKILIIFFLLASGFILGCREEELLEPNTDSGGVWTSGMNLPASRSEAFYAVVDSVFYVLGGYYQRDDATVYAYHSGNNGWMTRASMPAGRYQGSGSVVIGKAIYLIGGWTTTPGLPHDNLWRYDPMTNSWKILRSHPTYTAGGVAAMINGKLYVTTAADGYSGYRKYLFVYDTLSDWWTQLASSYQAHNNGAGGAINGRLYLAGGVDENGVLTSVVEEYNPASNSWTIKSSMPYKRFGSAGIVVGSKLLLVGGNNGVRDVDSVVAYDPISDTWSFVTRMSRARSFPAVGLIHNSLHVVGGKDSTGILSLHEVYSLPSFIY